MLRSPRERQPAELSEQESTEDAERRTAENVHPEHRLAGRCVRAEDSSDHERLDKSEVGVQEAAAMLQSSSSITIWLRKRQNCITLGGILLIVERSSCPAMGIFLLPVWQWMGCRLDSQAPTLVPSPV